jgi:hypothetical protein
MSLSNQGKIISLWAVFLFGTVFHTQLAVIPILYGQNVTMPNYHGAAPVTDLWLMLGFFSLPMMAIVATVLTESNGYRKAHFYLTIFYTIMNFLHVALDLMVTPIAWHQIALMVLLFINGVLLNVISYQWMQEPLGEIEWMRKWISSHT